MDGGAWWAAVHGVARSRIRLGNFTFTFYFHALEKEMATHSSVLAWRIPGTVEPCGLPSVGSHRVGHDWGDLAAAAAASTVEALRTQACGELKPIDGGREWEGKGKEGRKRFCFNSWNILRLLPLNRHFKCHVLIKTAYLMVWDGWHLSEILTNEVHVGIIFFPSLLLESLHSKWKTDVEELFLSANLLQQLLSFRGTLN